MRLRRATAVLEGRVYGPDGAPLAGIAVERHGPIRKWQPPRSCRSYDASDPAASNAAAQTTTDDRGRFRFENVPKGRGFLRVVDPRAAAPVPLPFEVPAGGTARVEFHPRVGTVEAEILAARDRWTEPFTLSLWDAESRRRATWQVSPPERGEERWGGARTHGFACTLQRRGEIRLWRCDPAEEILPRVENPGVTYRGPDRDVEVLEGGRGARIRNVPAGTWAVEVWTGRARANGGVVEVLPGEVASLSIVLP